MFLLMFFFLLTESNFFLWTFEWSSLLIWWVVKRFSDFSMRLQAKHINLLFHDRILHSLNYQNLTNLFQLTESKKFKPNIDASWVTPTPLPKILLQILYQMIKYNKIRAINIIIFHRIKLMKILRLNKKIFFWTFEQKIIN